MYLFQEVRTKLGSVLLDHQPNNNTLDESIHEYLLNRERKKKRRWINRSDWRASSGYMESVVRHKMNKQRCWLTTDGISKRDQRGGSDGDSFEGPTKTKIDTCHGWTEPERGDDDAESTDTSQDTTCDDLGRLRLRWGICTLYRQRSAKAYVKKKIPTPEFKESWYEWASRRPFLRITLTHDDFSSTG